MTLLNPSFDSAPRPPPIGLIVLQVDETLEPELRRFLPDLPNPLYVSRIPSQPTVTRETLTAMQDELAHAASLLPPLDYPTVGYGCTSASAILGSDEIERRIQTGCRAAAVTNPVRATIARAAHLGVSRFALVSPYVEEVNTPLRAAFRSAGLDMSTFGSFGIAEEYKVARITTDSVVEAAVRLGATPEIDAVFLSCTNLPTAEALPRIEARLGKPALSSNSALAWHLRRIASEGQ